MLTFGYNSASQMLTDQRSNDDYAFDGRANVNKPYAVNGLNQYTAAGVNPTRYSWFLISLGTPIRMMSLPWCELICAGL